MPKIKDTIEYTEQSRADIKEKVSKENIKATSDEIAHSEKIIKKLSRRFSEQLSEKEDLSEEEIRAFVTAECDKLNLTYEQRVRIEKTVFMTALGSGPIEPLIEDPDVTDIVVQRFDNVVYEKNGKGYSSDIVFNSEEHLQTIIRRIVQEAGRQINLINPIADARLKDGSRVNATLPPVSVDGATLTIRKFNNKALYGEDYIRLGSMNKEMLYFLSRCVTGKITIFVSGGTGTGKTTLLNMLSEYIPNDELIITIEDTCELKLKQKNIRRMEIRPALSSDMMHVDQKELIKAALRQRPDRIILGETRDGSIVDLIDAMSTGHEGSMSTIHADNPEILFHNRIPILYSKNKEADFSEKSIAMQVSYAIDIVVQIQRFPDGKRRITHITEVDGLDEEGHVRTNDIFIWNNEKQDFEFTGYYPKNIIDRIRQKSVSFDDSVFRKGTKNATDR